MMLKLDDAGRATSKRPRQKADCTVRALARVLTMTYDRAFDLLAKAGRKSCRPFDLEAWARKNAPYDGFGDRVYFRSDKMPFDKGDRYGIPKATKRYRLHDFLKDHPFGSYIVSTAGHVIAVKYGVAYDSEPWHYGENRPVYGWLELLDKQPQKALWRVHALRRPIKKGGTRMVKRAVAIVEATNFKEAMRVASRDYEWAIRKDEDLGVELY